MSIGVALWTPDVGGDLDTLLREADDALYREKESKKANTALAGPGPE